MRIALLLNNFIRSTTPKAPLGLWATQATVPTVPRFNSKTNLWTSNQTTSKLQTTTNVRCPIAIATSTNPPIGFNSNSSTTPNLWSPTIVAKYPKTNSWSWLWWLETHPWAIGRYTTTTTSTSQQQRCRNSSRFAREHVLTTTVKRIACSSRSESSCTTIAIESSIARSRSIGFQSPWFRVKPRLQFIIRTWTNQHQCCQERRNWGLCNGELLLGERQTQVDARFYVW